MPHRASMNSLEFAQAKKARAQGKTLEFISNTLGVDLAFVREHLFLEFNPAESYVADYSEEPTDIKPEPAEPVSKKTAPSGKKTARGKPAAVAADDPTA